MVEVSTEGQSEEVYGGLLNNLGACEAWAATSEERKQHNRAPDAEWTFEGSVLRPGIQV